MSECDITRIQEVTSQVDVVAPSQSQLSCLPKALVGLLELSPELKEAAQSDEGTTTKPRVATAQSQHVAELL